MRHLQKHPHLLQCYFAQLWDHGSLKTEKVLGGSILKITEEVMSQWVAGTPFLVRQSMQTISMRVILRAVFGLNDGIQAGTVFGRALFAF